MILPDVNVLLYAFRDDSPDHDFYRAWLESAISGPSAFGISPQTLSSVVRISTHPRIYRIPSDPDVALKFCRLLLRQPCATHVVPGERHWSIFDELCVKNQVTGNLVSDAWFAALAIEWGCEWVTLD